MERMLVSKNATNITAQIEIINYTNVTYFTISVFGVLNINS
jgi:hypothetical protein